MRIIESTDRRRVDALLERGTTIVARVVRRAARIVDDVRANGDAALARYAKALDGTAGELAVSAGEMRRQARTVPPQVRQAISASARAIRAVARRQLPRGWRTQTAPGVSIEQRVTPLDRVGCYVPGGRYPLPSSLLMTAIPARVAGVPEVLVVCPRPNAAVMFAALEAGVDRMFRIGGAQAIAALAFGTPRVPRVDKIVGPGNAYVAAAKALVSSAFARNAPADRSACAIDFFAGPSEIVVVSSNGTPEWIAADLIAQAEHDPDARAILLTPSRGLAEAVQRHCAGRVSPGTARDALRRRGGIVVTRDLAEAIALSQRIAPEHVVCDADSVARRLTAAGTVFVGRYSAQALGDYLTGSNHVLPTNGAARGRGGLSAADFVRVSNVQRITAKGLRRIGAQTVTFAMAEGLVHHAASVLSRLLPHETREGGRR